MILRTRIALAAQARRTLARLRLVVGQHIVGVRPLGILAQQIALLVERVGRVQRIQAVRVDRLRRFHLFDVEHWRPLVVEAVRERTVVAVLDAVAACVGVVHAHARFVVAQMVAAFGVAGGAV